MLLPEPTLKQCVHLKPWFKQLALTELVQNLEQHSEE